jgi:hypothetical protein
MKSGQETGPKQQYVMGGLRQGNPMAFSEGLTRNSGLLDCHFPSLSTRSYPVPEKVNKTKAVKDYLKQHPDAQNKEIAEALTKSGIKITPNYVAGIKGKLKTRRRKVKRAVKTVVASRGVGVPEIKAAMALLKLAGGVAGANAALAAAQEIREMV